MHSVAIKLPGISVSNAVMQQCIEMNLLHAWVLQYTELTHRFDEPVSNNTSKDWGGVPTLITPM